MLQCAIIIHGYFLISLMFYFLHISIFAVVEPWLDDLYLAIRKEIKQKKVISFRRRGQQCCPEWGNLRI